MPTHASGDTIVRDLMTRWPQTVPVFIRRRMSCPGCLMAPFMTVAEAAVEYGIAIDDLMGELLQAIEAAMQEPGT